MQKKEILKNATRSAGDLAGVFEFDEDTSYFYLYNTSGDAGQKVLGAIHIMSGTPDFDAAKKAGLTPTATGASRPICPECAKTLEEQNVKAVSPLK
jgi:hypothetical protein